MLENIKLQKAIVHEVLNAVKLETVKPNHSTTLVELDENGKKLISDRLVKLLGSESHCEEMIVSDDSAGSTFQTTVALLDMTAKEFSAASASLADRLSAIQNGGIKEGLGIFLQGTCVEDNTTKRWIAFVKADPDRGLIKELQEGKITLRYVSDLIMGAQQRLLKVVFFIESDAKPAGEGADRKGDEFSIRLYDHLLSNTGEGTAAQYFYSTFLGLKPAENSAKLCRLFFEKTKQFTDELAADSSEKVAFRGHLFSYLSSEKQQISATEFAETYIPRQHRRAYLNKMKQEKFPDNAVRRDVALIKAKLKKQSMRFTSKVLIVGNDDALQKSVIFGQVVQIKGEEWTELQIKGKLE